VQGACNSTTFSVVFLARVPGAGLASDTVCQLGGCGYYELVPVRRRAGAHGRRIAGFMSSEAARRLDDRRSFFVIRANQGLARVLLQQPDQAAEAFRDALAACREAGTEDLVDEPLFGLAVVTALQKDLSRAARLAGAARTAEHGSRGAVIWSRLEHVGYKGTLGCTPVRVSRR
jgi:hypothetical protein